MDAEIKARWTEALRSGKYQQAKGILCEIDPESEEPVGFCCLGVLVDVVHPEWWVTIRSGEKILRGYLEPVGYGTPWIASMGDHMYTETGLNFYQAGKLMKLNDQGVSFNEIADIIDGF